MPRGSKSRQRNQARRRQKGPAAPPRKLVPFHTRCTVIDTGDGEVIVPPNPEKVDQSELKTDDGRQFEPSWTINPIHKSQEGRLPRQALLDAEMNPVFTLIRGREERALQISTSDLPETTMTWKGRFTAAGTAQITGDCLANMVGYQATSGVVNRLADSIQLVSVKISPPSGGYTGTSSGTNVDPGRANLVVYSTDNYGMTSAYKSVDFRGDASGRSSGIKYTPTATFPNIIDCGATNRFNVLAITAPFDTEVDVTLRWVERKASIGMYTLTPATTTVGLHPWNAYLDNTNISGGVGAALIAHNQPIAGFDFSAYG